MKNLNSWITMLDMLIDGDIKTVEVISGVQIFYFSNQTVQKFVMVNNTMEYIKSFYDIYELASIIKLMSEVTK